MSLRRSSYEVQSVYGKMADPKLWPFKCLNVANILVSKWLELPY
jgi:hypothetical protein